MDQPTKEAKYPEHARLEAARWKYEPVKMFVAWLATQGVILGKPYGPDMMDRGGSGVTEVTDTEALVFRFLGLDAAKMKKEQEGMLDDFRLGRQDGPTDKGA